ncbi:CAAX amino terminal protease family protein [Tasmannia lanceolata]|uniref:CAAX amino terminal protease family protein n=1 Tax=Tasmannia lanceolata TaxID=3420 RepID=UPI004064A1FA
MEIITTNSCWSRRNGAFTLHSSCVNATHYQNAFFAPNVRGRKSSSISHNRTLTIEIPRTFGSNLKALVSRNSVKKARKDGQPPKRRNSPTNRKSSNEDDGLDIADKSSSGGDNSVESLNHNLASGSSTSHPARSVVIQACTVTSGLILALGLVIRQVSHIAFLEGWPILDTSTEVSFDFEMWHLELIVGLVIFISSCRYLLLKIWPDFAESSEAANQQVLSSLQPLDYVVIAFLPGISEELLFRGALLPLFGFNWMSALAVGAIFGALHLGSGRRYSFAVWATFVGFAYGFATLISSSIIVPMASHALNNLVGGILWSYSFNSGKKYN